MTRSIHLRSARARRAVRHVAAVAAIGVVGVTALVGCAASTPDPVADSPSPSSTGISEALQAEFAKVLEDTMAEFDVPGAVAGVWIPDEGEWQGAAGLADIENGTPTTVDMSWPLRSITKSYTVTLLLQLVDDGTVTLDDTIDMYVDGITNGDRITLRQLANMSSGNADYTSEAFGDVYEQDPTRIFTLEDLNSFVIDQPARFEPGADHIYTNANTNLLGAVIEKATTQPYADVLSERILTPLGLENTRYFLDAELWTEPHALGYGAPADPRVPYEQNFSIFGPAGSMISTLDDGRVWAETLATGALLEPETQEERLEGWPLNSPPPYDEYALGIGETNGWWGHNGEGLGYTAAVFHNPTSGATIVVFTNESNAVDRAHPADQIFRRLAAVVDAEVTP